VTRTAAVFGWPIEHSKSPEMMNAAFAAAGIDATMIAVGVPPERFPAAVAELRAGPMLGASVTIPHKIQAHQLCDERGAAAIATGAVNCLSLDGARLVGHNTDAPGFVDALREAGFEPRGTRVVIIGAGGSARAVSFGLSEAGAHFEVFSRSPPTWTPPRAFADLGPSLARADLVVDCTPAGIDPAIDAELAATLPLASLSGPAWVVTLAYHRQTLVLERARELGHSTLDGRGMLVHQGARAFEIWTGRPAPIAVMRRALDDSLAPTT
jgi:shikimate dehydrogenase